MAHFIYRVEIRKNERKKVGRGCYTSKGFSERMRMSEAHDDTEHPSIRTDVPDYFKREHFYKEHYCAFRNISLLKTWFEGYLEALLKENFTIRKYRVKEFIQTHSKKQLMFHPDNIISSKTFKIN